MDRCPRGRRSTIGNRVGGDNSSRGFKSHPVRHFPVAAVVAKGLTHRIVAPAFVGSNPIDRPILLYPTFCFFVFLFFRVPVWRNWQTRLTQNQVLAREWGFESLHRHHDTLNQALKITHRRTDLESLFVFWRGLILSQELMFPEGNEALVNRNARAYLEMTAAMAIVGSSVVVGKMIVSQFPVFLASGIRYGLASLVLLLWLYLSKKRFPALSRKEAGILLLQALTGVFGFSVFLLYGVTYTTAVASGIITSTTPMMIALISVLVFRERLSRRQLLGLVLAVCGMLAIHLNETRGGEGAVSGTLLWLGNLLVLGAVWGEAMFTILGKMLSNRLSPLVIATYVTVLGFLLFLPFAIWEGLSFDFSTPSLTDWLYIVYYALVVTVLGFYLWYQGVSKVSAGTSGVFTGVLPVSTVLLSYVFLGETFAWSHLLGLVCVLLGIGLTVYQKPEKQREEPAVDAQRLAE